MNKTWGAFLFWTPRVLGISIVGLLTLLSTDMFIEGYRFWEAILGFLIHMLPSFAVLIVLVLAWRWEWVGGLGFISFGIWYIAIAWDNHFDWITYAILAGTPGLIGILFWVGWVYRRMIKD